MSTFSGIKRLGDGSARAPQRDGRHRAEHRQRQHPGYTRQRADLEMLNARPRLGDAHRQPRHRRRRARRRHHRAFDACSRPGQRADRRRPPLQQERAATLSDLER